MDFVSVVMLIAIVGGLYLAWNTGANDVANAIGPSVGSGALTITHAIWLAIIFEFVGAIFAGGSVTHTFTHGIFPFEEFQGRSLELAAAMTCCIVSAAVWLNVSTLLGWPMSTTHCIMGAIFGGIWVMDGLETIHADAFILMVCAWISTPLIAFTSALLLFRYVSNRIYGAEEPRQSMGLFAPTFFGLVCMSISVGILFTGNTSTMISVPPAVAFGASVLIGIVACFVVRPVFSRLLDAAVSKDLKGQFLDIDRAFLFLQIPTACFLAFAHGSNDIANAVGPVSVVFNLLSGDGQTNFQMTESILLVGAVGIVIGLVTFGSRVVATVGKQITTLTAASGFVAVFCSATLVLLCTKLGIPVSTTHIVVGSIVGVGAARAVASLDQKVVKEILLSWLFTVPVTAILSGLVFQVVSIWI